LEAHGELFLELGDWNRCDKLKDTWGIRVM
jgi:hypothetical protein